MFSRYRLALFVSSLAVGGALLACPNPQERFDDFVERVPDARSQDMDGGCDEDIAPADVNGQFLLGLNDTTFGAFVFRFIADVTLTPVANGGQLTVVLKPLNSNTGELVTDGPPGTAMVTIGPVTVGRCADFTLERASLTIPQAASVSAEATLGMVKLFGQIRDANTLCGTAAGTVISPAGIPNLESGEGTTWGMTRITPGTVGNANLPMPLIKCPAPVGGDAGL